MLRERRHPDWLRVVISEVDAGLGAMLPETIPATPVFDLVGVTADSTQALAVAAASWRCESKAGHGIRRHAPGTQAIRLMVKRTRSTAGRTTEVEEGGYLVKGGSLNDIVAAIRHVSKGRTSLAIETTSAVIDELADRLSLHSREPETQQALDQRTRRTLRQRDALSVVFQPIVALTERRIVGAEALARFDGPPIRAPRLCFAEAPTIALRVELELAAVRKALVALPQIPESVFLAVNVSPVTLSCNPFRELIRSVDPTRLVAEVTEHAPIHDYDRMGVAIGKLRSLGMRLAVDDAGAGFASLRHILKLSPDLIKLDVTLIHSIQHDRSKQALAAGLISFADKSGATIIAEGVESEGEARTLVELGVKQGQGFYLGRPTPLPLRHGSERLLDRAAVV